LACMPRRVSKNPQTVKMSFLYHRLISAVVGTGHCPVLMPSGIKKPCGARHFDLLHNSNPTVPMYADGFELLVFGASLTSGTGCLTAAGAFYIRDCKLLCESS